MIVCMYACMYVNGGTTKAPPPADKSHPDILKPPRHKPPRQKPPRQKPTQYVTKATPK